MPKSNNQSTTNQTKTVVQPLPRGSRKPRTAALASQTDSKAVRGKTAPLKPAAPPQPLPLQPHRDASGAGGSKQAALLSLLRRPDGANLHELCEASDWQAHSVRGFLSGTVRKKLGLNLESVVGEQGRIYRIADNNSSDQRLSTETLPPPATLTKEAV